MRLTHDEVLRLIKGGESRIVEFKRSTTEIPRDVYETVCAFANREGGHIFLGIDDDGQILGIDETKIEAMKTSFVTTVNDKGKIYPSLYLTPIEYEIDGKCILYIYVPISQDVCQCDGKIFDRNHETDIDMTRQKMLYFSFMQEKVIHILLTKFSQFFL